MVMPRARALRNGLIVWNDAPLPQLPELYCGIFIREGGNRAAIEELADDLMADLRPEPFADRTDEEVAAISAICRRAARRRGVQLTRRSAAGGRKLASKTSSALGLAL